MKVFGAAFMCLQFGFVIFWQKEIGAKVAHTIIVKLTTGVISWENTTRDELRDIHYRIKSGEKVTVHVVV